MTKREGSVASGRLKHRGLRLLDNIEALIAIIGGGAALIADRISSFAIGDLVDAALLVLIAVAIGQLRDRSAREKLGRDTMAAVGSSTDAAKQLGTEAKQLSADVDMLREEVARIRAGMPYEVLRSRSTWDITDSGRHASTHKVRRLRFLRDKVVSVTDYAAVGAGTLGDPDVNEPYRWVGKVESDDGTRHDLIALDRAYNAGKEITLEVRRESTDAFTESRESVSHNIEDLVRALEMHVIWPIERRPTSVEIRRKDGSTTLIAPEQLTDAGDGRSSYTHTEENPHLGGRITISWAWAPLSSKSPE